MAELPPITIFAYFDFPFTTEAFTLDNPVFGQLDNVTYKLYDSTPIDVAPESMTLNIRRGTTSQLSFDAEAGSAILSLLNLDRTFDPIHSSGPYFGNLIPGRRLQIRAYDYTIFDGRIEDIDLNYEVSGMSTTVFRLVDGFGVLAAQQLDAFTATVGQTTGERLEGILDRSEVQWPYNRSIDTGISTLQGDAVAWGTNVLDYCRLVNNSELGFLYMDRAGGFTFKDRHASLATGPSVTFSDGSVGSGYPYTSIQVAYGSEQLFNRVGVTRAGGAAQTVIDLDAQLSYGVRSYTAPPVLLEDDDQALDMAYYLLGQRNDPQYRVTQLEVDLANLNNVEQEFMVDLDITNVVRVRFTPNGVGDEVDQLCLVYGVEHVIAPQSHRMVLNLGPAESGSSFRLDSATYGQLDTNGLAY